MDRRRRGTGLHQRPRTGDRRAAAALGHAAARPGSAVLRRRRSPLAGFVAHGFGPVADAFAANLASGDELGAALCVIRDGRVVADLWGGPADPRDGTPWRADTRVRLFSTSKGIAAAVAAVAVARGWIGYDDPLARHLPVFDRPDTRRTTLRDLLAHKTGLVTFGRVVARRELSGRRDPDRLFAKMRPAWPPGEAWGYHASTFGEILAALIEAVDPQGRTFAEVFADEVAAPLGLALTFGNPVDAPDRPARLVGPSGALLADGLRRTPAGLRLRGLDPSSHLHRAARELPWFRFNDPAVLALPFPSANAVGTARSVARLYACLGACLGSGGRDLGLTTEVVRELTTPPAVPPRGAFDLVMGITGSWQHGFVRPSRDFPFSPSPRAFGMPGLGGSFAFADPDRGLAYAYAPNRLGVLPFGDRRETALRSAVYRVVG